MRKRVAKGDSLHGAGMKRLFRRLQAVEKLQNREKGISRSLSQNNSMEGLLQYFLGYIPTKVRNAT